MRDNESTKMIVKESEKTLLIGKNNKRTGSKRQMTIDTAYEFEFLKIVIDK